MLALSNLAYLSTLLHRHLMVPAIPRVFGFDFDHMYFMDSRLEHFRTKYIIPGFSVLVTVIAAMSGLTIIQTRLI